MTLATAKQIEEKYNVYVDVNGNSYKSKGYPAEWAPIPSSWVDEFETNGM